MPANLRNQRIYEAFPELENSQKSIYIRLSYIYDRSMSMFTDLYSNHLSFSKSPLKSVDKGMVQLETELITIRTIEKRVIGTRNSSVTMQLQLHPKINRIAKRLSSLLVPLLRNRVQCTFPAAPCKSLVSRASIILLRIGQRWSHRRPLLHRPSDYLCENVSNHRNAY